MFLTCILLSLLVHIYTVTGCGEPDSAFAIFTDVISDKVHGHTDTPPEVKLAYRDSNGVPQITDWVQFGHENCNDMEGGWDYFDAFDSITGPWDVIYIKPKDTDGFLIGGIKYIGQNGQSEVFEASTDLSFEWDTSANNCKKTDANSFWIDKNVPDRCEYTAISLCGAKPEVFRMSTEFETIDYCLNCDSLISANPAVPVICGGIGEGVDNGCAYNIGVDAIDTITMENGLQYSATQNEGFVYIHPKSATENGFYEWQLDGINKLLFRATIGIFKEAHECGDGVEVNVYVDDILVDGPYSFSNTARAGVYEDIEIDIYDANKLKIEVTAGAEHVDHRCDQAAVAGPSFCGDPGCAIDPDSFDWDTLTAEGTNIPKLYTAEEDIFSIPDGTLSLNIKVELEYEGAATGDEGDGPFGVTYVLDFEDFNAYKDNIYEPGTCQNRDAADFEDNGAPRPFNEWWQYSDDPNLPGNIGSQNTMAYPPQTNTFWTQTMDTNNECGIIVYEGTFTWNNLVACASAPGGASYVETTDGPTDITLSGVFFVNVVSPYAKDADVGDGFYRVYQLLSKPFEIKISKSVYVLGEAGVNILTMSIIAVFKENAGRQPNNDFRLVVLTESQNYLKLSAATEGYLFNAAEQGEGVITAGKFTWPKNSEIVDQQGGDCLDNKAYICSQLWVIKADDLDCKLEAISFSGLYTLNFDTSCRDGQYNTYCAGDKDIGGTDPGWLAEHPGLSQVALEAKLTWRDEICDPKIFNIQFEADIWFYKSIDYKDVDGTPNGDGIPDGEGGHLFKVGEDNIYVEIDTDFTEGNTNVFDTKLINVWICTFEPGYEVSYTFDAEAHTGGCWDANRDGCENVNQDTCDAEGFENPYSYHIYQGDKVPPEEFEGFTEINTDADSKILRFYFKLPHRIARDTLYVQAQVEVTLQQENTPRRVLLRGGRGNGKNANKVANKMDHFIKRTGLTHDNNPNNNPQPPQYPQEPINYPQPQPQAPLPNPNPNTFAFNLSSGWIIAIGSLLAVILTFNIIFMCYMNCNKQQRGRVSFDSRRRNGYSSVKNIDSDVNESEMNAINVVSDESN